MTGGGSLVLCYHAVSQDWANSVAVRPEDLGAQLELLLQAGYRPVTFSEAVARPRERLVSVTFDDAFLSVLTLALPVLQRLGAVATMFVPTAWVGTAPLAWDGYDGPDRGPDAERAPLSWAQVRELAAQGWEIGSHTRRHPHLPQLDDRSLLLELERSREECAAGAGQPCPTLAYPYGEVDRRVRAAAGLAGYRAGAALGPQWRRHDPLWWPRTGVYRDDDLSRFRLKTSPATRGRAAGAGLVTARKVLALAGR